MNNDTKHDKTWQALLAHSAPTFAGEDTPPYGFMTSTLARLRAERGERVIEERIGFRALLASLVMLVVVAGFSINLQFQDGNDMDPGVMSVLQAERVSFS